MSEDNLTTYVREDGIRVFEIADSSLPTTRAWQTAALAILEEAEGPEKHLHDFRQLRGIPVHALQAGLKVNSHPKANLIYVAVLTDSSAVVDMVKLISSIQPGGRFRIFASEEEAVTWLNSSLP